MTQDRGHMDFFNKYIVSPLYTCVLHPWIQQTMDQKLLEICECRRLTLYVVLCHYTRFELLWNQVSTKGLGPNLLNNTEGKLRLSFLKIKSYMQIFNFMGVTNKNPVIQRSRLFKYYLNCLLFCHYFKFFFMHFGAQCGCTYICNHYIFLMY